MDVSYLFRCAVWVVTFALLIKEIVTYLNGEKTKKWRRHNATIIDVKVDVKKIRDSDGEGFIGEDMHYSMAFVSYKYQYQSKTYLSKKMKLHDEWSTDYGDSSSAVVGVSPGSEITIYVNPKKPKQSVLVRGYKNSNLKELVLIFIFALVVELFKTNN